MRKLICLLLLAAGAFAQDAPPPPRRMPPGLGHAMTDYQRRLDLMAKGISRDAFIVAAMVRASRDLHDFQRNAAMQKALDRVKEAQQRAAAEPPAGPRTLDALNSIETDLRKARESVSSADTGALAKMIIERSYFIQYDLFEHLERARFERVYLTDVQKRLSDLNLELETAMVEAIGSTVEFIRAGGR
jgi:hypothetical protein